MSGPKENGKGLTILRKMIQEIRSVVQELF
jgi:hypothetical protein